VREGIDSPAARPGGAFAGEKGVEVKGCRGPAQLGLPGLRATAELPAGERAVAKLALLTALASYQVDADVVASARRECADDAALIDLTAWASFTAARRAAPRYLNASRRSR
jgi:hypothetical protein